MNWVDLIILIVILVFAFEGQRRGLFVQIIDIFGFLASLFASLIFYSQAAILIGNLFNLPKIIANPVGFLLIWLLAEVLFFGLFGGFIKRFLQSFGQLFINRSLGFAPAIISSLLFLAFALLFIVSLPIKPDLKQDIYNSKIGSPLVASATILEKPLSSIFGPITKQGLTFLTIRPNETGTVSLNFTQSDLTVDIESEKKMFKLVNQERIKFGVKPLVWDESLAKIARVHSKDMFKRGYFSHFSPEGKDVGDRLEMFGISYSYAGENLALAPTVNRAHMGLMNSPGHRRNILDPTFDKIGIGVVDGDIYGKMFTQVFTD